MKISSCKRKALRVLMGIALIAMILPVAMPKAGAADRVITSVEVTGVEMPVEGKSPYYSCKIPEGAHYRLMTPEECAPHGYSTIGELGFGMIWFNRGSDDPLAVLPEEEFQADVIYELQVPLIPEDGYNFAWSLTATVNGETAEVDSFPEDGDCMVWIRTKAGPSVKFDANGGTCETTLAALKPDADSGELKLAELPTPTREGYEFDGWFTEADGGDAVDADTVYSGSATIYAHWTEISTEPENPPAGGDTDGQESGGNTLADGAEQKPAGTVVKPAGTNGTASNATMPNTGDDSHMALWLALLAAGFAGALIVSRKRAR